MRAVPNIPLHPITADVREERFVSPHDGTSQTYLIAESSTSSANAGADDREMLLIYLHGATNHQEQGMNADVFDRTFARLWSSWIAQRNAVYVCPEYRGNSWMGPAAEADVAALIEQMRARYRPKRVILSGGSMGGTAALIFGSRNPESIDGVLALCPATDPAEMFERFPQHFLESYGGSPTDRPAVFRERTSRHHADQLARVPIVIVHGECDAIVPVHHARLLIDALKRHANARFKYIELAGGNHDVPLTIDLGETLDLLLSISP